ncbi:coronin-7-like [Asterias rubens]|uniref:coronin-7-like n=1 Tax=Asterias rubens TaxID=7604 RepID=UPI001455061D|nr:coronin-7-like [Asterias rubens]
MSRFGASKFKNAVPKVSKKEQWINDIPIGSPSSCGNHIKASCKFMAFNTNNTGGGTLAVIPLDKSGRGMSSLPMLHAHSALVTDMDFSPFDDNLLATCSSDNTIKLWDIPEGGLTESMSTPRCMLTKQEQTVQNVLFHPTADQLLASSCDKTLHIWDINKAQECIAMNVHTEQIQGVSWRQDGGTLATAAKDKKLRILDPRTNSVCFETDGHGGNKETRVCWLGDADFILTSGFNKLRDREVCIWDQRKFVKPVASQDFDRSTGIMLPLYDADTKMLFLAGIGDTRIWFCEIQEKTPFITQGIAQQVPEQVKGIAMIPKRAVDVMSCEVNRLLQLTMNAVIPISYEVPRKSHRDFYGELFPDTAGGEAALSAEEWLQGGNEQVLRISLDPAKRKVIPKKPSPSSVSVSSSGDKTRDVSSKEPLVASTEKNKPLSEKPSSPQKSDDVIEAANKLKTSSLETPKSTKMESGNAKSDEKMKEYKVKPFVAPSTSKYRHMNSCLMPRSTHMINLHNLSSNVFGECDVFHVNSKWGAIPLGGAGGLIAFLDLNLSGKLERDLPAVQNGSSVMDFAWDPFNNCRLAVACDNARILLWDIPSDGWTEAMTEPSLTLRGHREKLYFVKFHPQAADILMSASYDMTVKIWDLTSGEEKHSLTGHTDQIFSGAWSADGSKIATVCKDGQIRIYEPRSSSKPIKEGSGPEGTRGARILWVCGDSLLMVTGFGKSSQERMVSVYSVQDLSGALDTLYLDTSPATLVPYYDEDTNVAILTGKGDTSVIGLEILPQPPYFLNLAPFQNSVPHQALSFLPKSMCNVKDVEFAKAMRLTQTSIEPVSFSVPRVKKEYFQDDIFPDTRVKWEAALSAQEWLAGKNAIQGKLSLCPPGMKLLSSIPKMAPAPKKYMAEVELSYKTDEQKKEELMSAFSDKLAAKNEPLPQEQFEGVDEDEWSD